MLHKAVFLDKDGTIIEDLPYNVDPARIRFLPGTMEGVRRLHAAGYLLFVVTNQSGIARGFYTEEDMDRVAAFLGRAMSQHGVPLAGYYYCPHLPQGTVPGYNIECMCRKPQPGLIIRASREHPVDLKESWFIGDILNYVEAGRRAGCRTVLIDNGKETDWILTRDRMPHHVAANIADAAAIITALPP
jgi:D,D-heptose 1,7-bisphosphate phosphatase